MAVDNILDGDRRLFRHTATSTRVNIKGLPVLALGAAHATGAADAVSTLT